MIICVCNNIKSSDIQRDPQLLAQCGSQCGTCKRWLDSPQGTQYIHCLLSENTRAVNKV